MIGPQPKISGRHRQKVVGIALHIGVAMGAGGPPPPQLNCHQ